MAISNTPPPQAYTREVLAQAFNWLKAQPQSVRERALSADALVSLYLHAKRYGSAVTPWDQDSQVGANAFKSDLKNLAQGFKEFDQEPEMATAVKQTVQTQTLTTTHIESSLPATNPIDTKSLEILREVQKRLNLSSELEALRMLVLLGFEKIKPLLPP